MISKNNLFCHVDKTGYFAYLNIFLATDLPILLFG